jgi:tRNA (adenine37-N6)-methyltransferase
MPDSFKFEQIGVIRTPYTDAAPYQPLEEDEGEFRLVLGKKYVKGLESLDSYNYIYVLYFIDRLNRSASMTARPPWARDMSVGLFASRSPSRPNPIGLSVVRIKKIERGEVFTSGLDAFDKTPLLDIKPYIKDLDSKNDANFGWLDDFRGSKEHLLLHIKGIAH